MACLPSSKSRFLPLAPLYENFRITSSADWSGLRGAFCEIDWSWIQNLVYRYLEVLASGSLLIAPNVPGVDRYFKPGIHFVSYENNDDAIDENGWLRVLPGVIDGDLKICDGFFVARLSKKHE